MKTEGIAISFINGNISWVKKQIKTKKRLAEVASWFLDNAPDELSQFLRVMSQ